MKRFQAPLTTTRIDVFAISKQIQLICLTRSENLVRLFIFAHFFSLLVRQHIILPCHWPEKRGKKNSFSLTARKTKETLRNEAATVLRKGERGRERAEENDPIHI